MTGHTERRDSPRFLETVTSLLRDGQSVRFRAHGWSMFPAIRDGELITVAPLGAAPVRTGDIVLFRHGRGVTAHRVIGLRLSRGRLAGIIARGDAAQSPDEPIAPDHLLGRVVAGRSILRRSRTASRALGGALKAGHRVRAAIRTLGGLVASEPCERKE